MRAAELLGREVLDRAGRSCGRVLDIRITRDESSPDPGRWRIDGLVVGRRTSFARAGYAYGAVDGPLPLAIIMRALGRHLRFVPWDQISADLSRAITIQGDLSGLVHPREV
jgi:hypothetical protein